MTRTIARTLAVLTAALVGAAAPAQAQETETPPAVPAWAPVSGLPLSEPVQVHARNGVLKVTLDAKLQTISVSDSPIRAQPFNGRLLGPTLHVRPGDTIEVTFINTTPQETNIHYHGMHVSPRGKGDNVFRSFAPGTTVQSRITLPKDHPVGSYWYHAHFHGLTDIQLAGGMSGLIVVEGLKDLLPKPLRDVPERQIVIRDLQTNPNDPASAALSENELDPQSPTTRLVNGLLMPRTALRQGQTELWHMANVSADLFYDVELEGHQFTIIAQDGNPVWDVKKADHLVMPPGRRYDVLVTGGAPGTHKLLTRAYPQEGFEMLPRADLMTLDVLPAEGRPAPAPRLPRSLDDDRAHFRGKVAKRRTFKFSFGTGSTFTALINGKQFDPAKTDVRAVLGTIEEWTLVNESTEEHPFHIHVNDFEVISVNGKPYRATGPQDVVIIPRKIDGKAGTVVMRTKFEDFTGHFVFHCHILAHEDAGMMMAVDVVRPGQKATPPPEVAGHTHQRLVNATTPAWLCPLLRDEDPAVREV